jgi:hypothetical protein
MRDGAVKTWVTLQVQDMGNTLGSRTGQPFTEAEAEFGTDLAEMALRNSEMQAWKVVFRGGQRLGRLSLTLSNAWNFKLQARNFGSQARNAEMHLWNSGVRVWNFALQCWQRHLRCRQGHLQARNSGMQVRNSELQPRYSRLQVRNS